MSTETKVFGAFVLLCTLFISGIVFYDIYTHPADPNPAGTATILIGGTSGVRFSGDVGTLREPLGITATTPVAVETPYRRADWVIANLQKEDDPTNRGTLRVKIVKYKPRLNENKPGASRPGYCSLKPERLSPLRPGEWNLARLQPLIVL